MPLYADTRFQAAAARLPPLRPAAALCRFAFGLFEFSLFLAAAAAIPRRRAGLSRRRCRRHAICRRRHRRRAAVFFASAAMSLLSRRRSFASIAADVSRFPPMLRRCAAIPALLRGVLSAAA